MPREDDVDAAITGLTPGTTYYYEIVATNALGTATGHIVTCTTPSS